MTSTPTHKWTFRARFRRRAFGWKSQPAIKRIKEAVAEIEKVSREDPLLAAEGAVLFLERVSPAIEHVDSSSGAIGGAVDRAVAALVEVIARAPADEATRQRWLERMWRAYLDDEIPYLEELGDRWGELCVSPGLASRWADEFMAGVQVAWGEDPGERGYFSGTTACMSALLAAGRHEEVLELLDMAPYNMWHYRRYGVRALVAMGRGADAITLAEDRGLNDSGVAIAQACEQVLLDAGLVDEAYARYGLVASRERTNLAWFKAVTRKYPHRPAADVLGDLVAHTPGDEGKWFAAAKSARLFDEAIELANRSPCSPKTLTRAARDFEEKNPSFALEAGMAALTWLVEGYGHQVTGADVRAAYDHTMRAAEHAGVADQTRERVRDLVSHETFGERFVTRILGNALGI